MSRSLTVAAPFRRESTLLAGVAAYLRMVQLYQSFCTSVNKYFHLTLFAFKALARRVVDRPWRIEEPPWWQRVGRVRARPHWPLRAAVCRPAFPSGLTSADPCQSREAMTPGCPLTVRTTLKAAVIAF